MPVLLTVSVEVGPRHSSAFQNGPCWLVLSTTPWIVVLYARKSGICQSGSVGTSWAMIASACWKRPARAAGSTSAFEAWSRLVTSAEQYRS